MEGPAFLVGPNGVRAGWRILLFLLLGALLTAAASVVLELVTRVSPWRMDPSTVSFAATLLGMLAAGCVMLRFLDRRPAGALGFALEPAALRDSAMGFGVGGGMLGGAVALLAVAGTARWVADSGTVPEYAATLATALLTFAIAAAAEEVIFRGYAFQALVQGIGGWPAAIIMSALFAAAHLGNDHVDFVALANIFFAGIMLSVAYLRTRSLWFATGIHLGWNWTMSALLDFPVSGIEFNTPLYSARELGADWWTGGAFGPEAGIAATLAIVAGTAWMLRSRRLAESVAMRGLRPLVDDRLGAAWDGGNGGTIAERGASVPLTRT